MISPLVRAVPVDGSSERRTTLSQSDMVCDPARIKAARRDPHAN